MHKLGACVNRGIVTMLTVLSSAYHRTHACSSDKINGKSVTMISSILLSTTISFDPRYVYMVRKRGQVGTIATNVLELNDYDTKDTNDSQLYRLVDCNRSFINYES